MKRVSFCLQGQWAWLVQGDTVLLETYFPLYEIVKIRKMYF